MSVYSCVSMASLSAAQARRPGACWGGWRRRPCTWRTNHDNDNNNNNNNSNDDDNDNSHNTTTATTTTTTTTTSNNNRKTRSWPKKPSSWGHEMCNDATNRNVRHELEDIPHVHFSKQKQEFARDLSHASSFQVRLPPPPSPKTRNVLT